MSDADQAPATAAPTRTDAPPNRDAREKIKVSGLFKIFGDHPKDALDLIDRGFSKDVVFEKTKQTVGVNDANLSIREGEIFVVMGLSGSGKSTLVRLLNRLIEPTRGSVEVDGIDIAKISNQDLIDLRRRDMSMVFQSFALLPHLKVIDNAAFGLELAGVRVEERHEKALAALEQVGLAPYAQSYPNQLSGGMQQRVGLARALANDPSILLMDEAFSALDPLIRAEMQDELLRLQAEQQRTVVFISHDLDEAMRIGDRIAIMEGGSIVQVGTPDEILRNPADAYVRNFFSGVDISKVLTVADIANNQHVTVLEREGHGIPSAISRLKRFDRDVGYLIDRQRRFLGLVTAESLHKAGKTTDDVTKALVPEIETIDATTTLTEAVPVVARSTVPVPVIDEAGKYRGAVSKTALLEALDRTDDATEEAA